MFENILIYIGKTLRRLSERRALRPTVYFLPGEIGFNVQHSQPFNPNQFDALIDMVSNSAALNSLEDHVVNQEIKAALNVKTTEEIMSRGKPFTRTRPHVLTITPPKEVQNNTSMQFISTVFIKADLTNSELLYAATEVNNILKPKAKLRTQRLAAAEIAASSASSRDFQMLGATLNWLSSVGQGGGGVVGGPGSVPRSVNQTTAGQRLDQEVRDFVSGQIQIVWAVAQQASGEECDQPKPVSAQAVDEEAEKARIEAAVKAQTAEVLDKIKKVAKNAEAHAQDVEVETLPPKVEMVEIVVLDTLPPLPLLAAQFQKFVGPNNPNSTLNALLHPISDYDMKVESEYLTLTPKSPPVEGHIEFKFSYNLMRNHDSRLLMDALTDHDEGFDLLQYHPHKVVDHGLFVVGTIYDYIHRIAPEMKARIHLVQTLSDYGVGTLTSLQHSLNFVLNDRDRKENVPLVINCSLMMTAPRYSHTFRIFGLDKRAHDIVTFMETPNAAGGSQSVTVEDMFAPIEHAIYGFPKPPPNEQGGFSVDIIAAAGNENLPTRTSLPQARYPAAFCPVMGVGAIDVNGNDTRYTNERDAPPSDGAKMVGGDADLDNGNWEPRPGVPGVYIGEFPLLKDPVTGKLVREVNHEGWAMWAGTSFAAPRATAIQAIVRYY